MAPSASEGMMPDPWLSREDKEATMEGKVSLARDLEQSLGGPDPVGGLIRAVQALLAAGYDRRRLEAELTELMLDLRAAGREREEDVVLEVLDDLVGWCSPHVKL